MKTSILLLACVFAGASARAQDRGALDKALRDPQRHAQEARADRYVRDSTRISTAPSIPPVKGRPVKTSRKGCRQKKDPAR